MTIGNRPATVRADGRGPNDLRPISFELGVQKWAEGSCRVRFGDTEVLCAATIVDRVPPHLRGKGTGWITAEYSMLPRATAERTDRESVKGRIGGRTHEIQRLIGRSLRGVVDLSRLGERTITVDCDVLQADGGTRTASITGGYVALAAALITYGMERHLRGKVSAISVGIVNGVATPRPRLFRGFARGRRLQRRRHRRRGIRRAAGHRRGAAVRPRGDERTARPGRRRACPIVRGTGRDPGHRPAVTDRRLLVASRSVHKLRELRELLTLEETELVSLDDLGIEGDPVEDGETFETNAAIKARFGLRASGLPTLADDSGIEVDALGGGPGVRTRRYAGEDATDEANNAKLLDALGGLPPERRGARYVCVLALALPGDAGPRGGVPLITARGTCRGRIATEPRGTGGFGYDPIFEPASEPPGGRTLGLWTPAEKHAISHRARAARRMAPRLAELGFR